MQSGRSILEMDFEEARIFLLKQESYFNGNLPKYIDFSKVIKRAREKLNTGQLSDHVISKDALASTENVNYQILTNKDGSYAWRPLQMIHPMVYVDLVNTITSKENWTIVVERFCEFQKSERIICVSIPREARDEQKDVAENISSWWKRLEQAQIKYSLEYNYCAHADITDCYPSIYTHTVAWAIHTREWAKQNRNIGLGNEIDRKICDSQNGQTNGIPQGSVLMDFVAEIVLGYADLLLMEKMDDIDYKILRYRDDYRIFTKEKEYAEIIIKTLTEVLSSINLNLNASKTFITNDIIINAVKADKIYWERICYNLLTKSKKGIKYNTSIQKHLLQIKILGDEYRNCGSLNKALCDVYKFRIVPLKHRPKDLNQLISIIVSIMRDNPRTIERGTAILSKLFEFINPDERNEIIDKILEKFNKIPNTNFMEIWLQRLSLTHSREKDYDAKMCKKVINPSENIWNSDWLKVGFDECDLIDELYINDGMRLVIPVKEVELFASLYDEVEDVEYEEIY